MEEKRTPEEGPQGPVDEPRGGRAEERGDAGGDVQDALAPDGAGGAEGLAPEKAEPPSGGLKSKASMLAAAAMKARQDREALQQKIEQEKKLSLLGKIQKLDVGERAKLARSGDKDCRTILIKDSNKTVSLAVLGNPKITINEIEFIAASRNVDEDVLREIGKNRDWCKSYTVIHSLVQNPKTPVATSLTFLPKLIARDLRFISKSKGVPEAVRMTAKRLADKRSF